MQLNNILDNDGKAYFLEMLHADSLRIAEPFLAEEQEILCTLIHQHDYNIKGKAIGFATYPFALYSE